MAKIRDIKIKKPLVEYKVELAPSVKKQYSKNGFDAIRESYKFYATNSDYELNKSKEMRYTVYNNNDQKQDKMPDPTKGFKPSVGTRSASALYNASLLLLFMNHARLFFENLVIIKGGEDKLNRFEEEMMKLCRCRETNLELLIMSIIYEYLVKPTFLAIKATEEIKNIRDGIKLVNMVDQILYVGQQNTTAFIDGIMPTMFEEDMTQEQKIFRIMSSTIMNDYLKENSDEMDIEPKLSQDNYNISQMLVEMVPTLPKHEQATWQVLHQEADKDSRHVMENMMQDVLNEIKILHTRRTQYLRKGSELFELSKQEIDELGSSPVDNDNIEASFGKYSQYGNMARNSNNNTRQIVAMSQVNDLRDYLDELEEDGKLDKIIDNTVSFTSKYVQEAAKKDMEIEKERAELLKKSVQQAKIKSSLKHKQTQESLAKAKTRITKEDVNFHINTLNTKHERIQYYKSILNNYKKVEQLKKEIEEKLKIKLTWSEGRKQKNDIVLKGYVDSIIDYYQPEEEEEEEEEKKEDDDNDDNDDDNDADVDDVDEIFNDNVVYNDDLV